MVVCWTRWVWRTCGPIGSFCGPCPTAGVTCGFFCGREELLHWPRYDLLQLVLDTKPLYGGLENLLPAFSPADTAAAVHIGAANLYHAPATATSTETTRRVSGLSGQVRLFPAAAGPLPPLRLLRRHHGRAQAPLPETGLDDSDCDACYQALIRWTSSLMGAVPEA
jgi:hypothetical protein